MGEWHAFASYMREEHGISVDCLDGAFAEEHEAYFMRTAQWQSLEPQAVVGEPCSWFSLDVSTATVQDLKSAIQAPFQCPVLHAGPVQALAGWFDVTFGGSAARPADFPLRLSTAPAVGYTHWGQQVFVLPTEVAAEVGDEIRGAATLSRQPRNERTLYLDVAVTHVRDGEVLCTMPDDSSKAAGRPTVRFAID